MKFITVNSPDAYDPTKLIPIDIRVDLISQIQSFTGTTEINDPKDHTGLKVITQYIQDGSAISVTSQQYELLVVESRTKIRQLIKDALNAGSNS